MLELSHEFVSILATMPTSLDDLLKMIISPRMEQHRLMRRWSTAGIASVSYMVIVHRISSNMLPCVLSRSRLVELLLLVYSELLSSYDNTNNRSLQLVSQTLMFVPKGSVSLDSNCTNGIEKTMLLFRGLVMYCISSPDQSTRTKVWRM